MQARQRITHRFFWRGQRQLRERIQEELLVVFLEAYTGLEVPQLLGRVYHGVHGVQFATDSPWLLGHLSKAL